MKRKPDAAWKMLFSTREIVRDLIAGFVGSSWIRMLDLDTLEKVPTHYVDRQMRQRITDVVWRVGVQRGEALMLQRLLAKRFGPLPSAIVERLASASREQIEIWGDRVFDARSIDEVFAD